MQTKSISIHSTRIALYGGVFDPVHNAHLELARHSLCHSAMDRVVFIPAAQSPLKSHVPYVTDMDRLEMLNLAIAGESRFCVDRYEIEKGGVSYSLDTVRYFERLYPKADLYWIIGADQFERLAVWQRIDELVAIIRFLVFARSGYQMVIPSISGLRFERIERSLMSESSSHIRAQLAGGRSICGLVPEAVEAFILAHELYKNS